MGWLRRGMNFQRCPNVIGPASWRAKTCGADFYSNGPVTNFASRRRGSRTAPSSFLSLRFLIGERARTFHISASATPLGAAHRGDDDASGAVHYYSAEPDILI